MASPPEVRWPALKLHCWVIVGSRHCATAGRQRSEALGSFLVRRAGRLRTPPAAVPTRAGFCQLPTLAVQQLRAALLGVTRVPKHVASHPYQSSVLPAALPAPRSRACWRRRPCRRDRSSRRSHRWASRCQGCSCQLWPRRRHPSCRFLTPNLPHPWPRASPRPPARGHRAPPSSSHPHSRWHRAAGTCRTLRPAPPPRRWRQPTTQQQTET